LKTIELCGSYAAVGVIKQYQEQENINNVIIPFNLVLQIGDIKNNREEFLKEFAPDINFCIEESLTTLSNNIDKNTKVRIWSSKKNDDDYLLLLYLCNYLKDKCSNISVIYTSDYSDYAWSLDAMDYKEVYELLKYERDLSKIEIEKLSNNWSKLVNQNSELRIMENDEIQNKKYSDYDQIIIDNLKNLGQCKICNLIARLMLTFVINNSSDLVYLYLIDRLIKNNKIKIISKGERHFVDIIEAV